MRLKPPAAALSAERDDDDDIRERLWERFRQRERGAYQRGFEAGQAARQGPPEPAPAEPENTYPRIRSLG